MRVRPPFAVTVTVVVVVALVALVPHARPARAAESDPYWGWYAQPADATTSINRRVNMLLVAGLAEVNLHQPGSCREAVKLLTAPLIVTSRHFFYSRMRHWPMDRSPRDERERARFDAKSVYRDTPLSPFGHWVPLDPTLHVDDVLFGPDKIGHFFTNGRRAWERFDDARAAGSTEEAASYEALRYGAAEERGYLGLGIDGVFSFADLHAMAAGVRFFRSLCDDGRLARGDDGRWTLSPLFALEEWIDPCWDESFTPSAFAPSEAENVAAAVRELCPLLDEPFVRTQRDRYRARGCHEATVARMERLVTEGEAPSPLAWDIEHVCARERPQTFVTNPPP